MNAYLFDLDGTLVDSIGDIAACANLVRGSFGMAPIPEALILTFIGKGSRHLVARALVGSNDGADPDAATLDEGVRRWVELYETHMMDRTRLFPGIAQALARLHGPKAIVTNKPGESARRLCQRVGLDRMCAAAIVGLGDVAERKPARDGIDRALALIEARGGGTAVECAVFIGDSEIDGEAARTAGLPFVGVLWGLGTRAELERAGARAIAEHPDELVACCERAMG
ncbi:MAG: HAD hydrolase-like protein [Myxococcales bacterium]|nr:HAD hydrolase-like protein [Myxococcales bacterium]